MSLVKALSDKSTNSKAKSTILPLQSNSSLVKTMPSKKSTSSSKCKPTAEHTPMSPTSKMSFSGHTQNTKNCKLLLSWNSPNDRLTTKSTCANDSTSHSQKITFCSWSMACQKDCTFCTRLAACITKTSSQQTYCLAKRLWLKTSRYMQARYRKSQTSAFLKALNRLKM